MKIRRRARLHHFAKAERHGPGGDLRAQILFERAADVPGSIERLRGELVALAVLFRVVLGIQLRVGHRGVQLAHAPDRGGVIRRRDISLLAEAEAYENLLQPGGGHINRLRSR